MSTLSLISGRQFADGDGVPYVGAKAYHWVVGSTTAVTTYSDADLTVPNASPVVADADGYFDPVYLADGVTSYRLAIYTADDTLHRDWPEIEVSPSQATLGSSFYPQTAGEIAGSVTPTYYYYEPGDVRRYGAVGDGSTDDTAAIQRAINTGGEVHFHSGTYLANNLTQTASFQKFMAFGWVRIKKNANGPIITTSGSDVEFNGIGFAGDASTPTYTGNGITSSGNNLRLINCGVRWISGYPVYATGQHVQIVGTDDIYQTTDATSTGRDIWIGQSGTATLYHRITGIKTSQATGGIQFIDCGGQAVVGCQFGKLAIGASGSSPAGVNGGNYSSNRILGDITADISSSVFSGNTIGAVTITFSSTTSGHRFDSSNALDNSATITDNSTSSVIEDSRLVPFQTYTPTWTGSSVNPAIGNGTLTGYYTRTGKITTVVVRMLAGSSTTYGTGNWFFALPSIPVTTISTQGAGRILDFGTANYTCTAEAMTDGTARCFPLVSGTPGGQVTSAVPHTWATSDELRFTLTYISS